MSTPQLFPYSLVSLVLLVLAAGCARLPVAGELPSPLVIVRLATVVPGAPMAWAPQAERIALVDREGLKIRELDTGQETLLNADHPAALAWNRVDGRLAAAFVENGRSRVRVFADGREAGEVELPGEICNIAWREPDELLAVAVEIKEYSFGANYRALLYRGLPDRPGEVQVLTDTTLKNLTLHRWRERLACLPGLDVSPWADEIVYRRLHDPPQFDPYLKVVLRHLDSGEERVLGQSTPAADGAIFSADGREVVFGDGSRATFRIDPWGGEAQALDQSPGRSLAISPGGVYLWIDGDLLEKGRKLAAFSPGARGRFAPDGNRLLIAHKDNLFLLEGLRQNRAPDLAGENREALLRLRRWRSMGLISQDEYLQQRKRIEEQ